MLSIMKGGGEQMSKCASIVKQLREQKSLTQEELANQVGVSLSTIQKWEDGAIGAAKASSLMKLCEVLDADVKEIVR